jgi:endonuclease YncB( thermonuclease family)
MQILIAFLIWVMGLLPLVDARANTMGKPDIIDGNTIAIAGEAIRLYGIDAPELRQTCKDTEDRGWACGKEAMFALLRFFENHWVTCRDPY